MENNINNFKILYLVILPDVGGGLIHLLEILNFNFNYDLLYLIYDGKYDTAGTIFPAEILWRQNIIKPPELEELDKKNHKIIKININSVDRLLLLPGMILSFYFKICRLKKKLLMEKINEEKAIGDRKNIFYHLIEKPIISLYNKLLPIVLAKNIHPEKYDIIHIFSINICYSVMARVAQKTGKKTIITPLWHIGENKKECIEEFLPYYEAITVSTQSEKDFFVNLGVGENKIIIIPPPIKAPETEIKIDFKKERNISGKIVLFIGNQTAKKGIHLILEATEKIWIESPKTFFVFIGPKSKEELLTEIKDRRIINLGYVDEEVKKSALAACDIFCLPSRCESFGMFYAEAFHFKKPVIALNTPVSRDVIEKFEAGFLVNNAEELAEKIIFIFNNPNQAEKMGNNGYNSLKNYEPELIKNKLGALYEKIMEK